MAGPAGCGKSECIKTFALAERERGKIVDVQSVYTKASESLELLGYFDESSRCVNFLMASLTLLFIATTWRVCMYDWT